MKPAILLLLLSLTAAAPPVAMGESDSPVRESPGNWIEGIGAPYYFAVRVENARKSAEWYRRTFGLREVGGSEAENGSWRIVNLSNDHLFVEIIRDDRAQGVDRARGLFKVGFQVPDVETVADAIEKQTGDRPRVLDFRRFGVRIVQIRDPEGNIIQISSRLNVDAP